MTRSELFIFSLFLTLLISPSFPLQKREKRRWIFRRSTNLHDTDTHQTPSATEHASSEAALAVAVATAEAAVATAQAAVEIARLPTRPSNHARYHYAAIVIQTAFRGYLVC